MMDRCSVCRAQQGQNVVGYAHFCDVCNARWTAEAKYKQRLEVLERTTKHFTMASVARDSAYYDDLETQLRNMDQAELSRILRKLGLIFVKESVRKARL